MTGRLTVISGGREDLTLLGGNDSVTGNELGEDSASGLDTESKRAHVDKDEILGTLFTGKNTTLNGGTMSDSLVGVDTLGGLLSTEIFLEELLDLGDTSGTTDENDLYRD